MSPVENYFFNQKVYADGLSQENLPPATVGNRQASLYVKVNPPVLTTSAQAATANGAQNAYMQFRLFDAKTNQTIQHVTYQITVTRGTSTREKPLLLDFFHAHNGLLTLKIEPTNGQLTIFGEQDPFLQAWVADPGGNILIRGPLLLQGGLYHFHIEIFSIDNDRNIFIPAQAPKFDAYLSVGDVYHNIWNNQGQNYNTTLISYYDKISNLKFDASKPMFTWSMPFNYNITRINQQPIFVHEEMRLPKSWKGFGDLNQFNATVNGQQLSGRSLAIDPFSFPNDQVVHFLVNKNDIVKLAQVANSNSNNSAAVGITKTNTTGLINFALSPLNATTQITTSSDIPTNTGSIHAAISWSPNPLAANTQSTLKISFYDPTSTAPLTNTNVRYNLIIFDKNNHPVITKQNLLAKNAADTETIVFPANEIYHMQVQITGLVKAGQTPDLTRNGVATGYVIVPEFPSAAISAILILGVILAGLFARKTIFKGLIK
ncbi:MAG TPA: hypothetical protein VFI73_10470 [Candidatus Nitrosopolaris sp.]|nr:hypothetical protein [Candidatus Nitrosopolaris sp.]